jgi:spermidine/putrescine transport system ATP-binding protein
VTFIYITHDQSEALAMSDRIAVMSEGVLQQVGAPRELYDDPATPFVATFVGETNAIAGKVTAVESGVVTLETALGPLRGRAGPGVAAGSAANLYVRPEALAGGETSDNSVAATVDRIDFEGAFALAHGRFDDGAPMVVSIPGTKLAQAPAPGERATFGFASRHAVVLPHG